MTRPQFVRADTIDLQANDTPSAQTHHRPAPDGSVAPHQAETLRDVAAETAEENSRSPRVSWNADSADVQQHALALNTTFGGQQDGSADNMHAAAQEDALAIAQNGGLSGQEADGETEIDDDDMGDRISSSPSIEDEDIDFAFVYALHTFVATVEGQANATKGDTMVLLDDSNSYWWLVRVVKDSSIGYLPAEHIETPTERVARQNKHRNIDLSASMLGDQQGDPLQDKARNPIRSAMKRRKAKTVQFAAPTYVDYSDFDYSTEEEDEGPQLQPQQRQQVQQSASQLEMNDETAKVEPLKPRSQQKDTKTELKKQDAGSDSESPGANKTLSRVSEESEMRVSDGPKKSSDGTVRDSFFKDDSVETKKISLTPNLLRDDNAPRTSTESREMKQRPSLDKLDKDSILGKDDRKRKKEKEKDKKAGGIRSFFSRKDKKAKGDEDEDPFGKRSMDTDNPEKEVEDEEPQPSPERAGPQRQPSKLQKQQPRAELSPTRKPNGSRENGVDIKAFLSEGKVNNVANNPPSMRLVEASPKASPDGSPREEVAANTPSKSRPQKTTKTKSRMDLDEDSSDEDLASPATGPAPVHEEPARQQARAAPGTITPAERDRTPEPASAAVQTANVAPKMTTSPAQQPEERLSESPVQVSPITSSIPPPLTGDSSSSQAEEDRVSPRSTPSPELIEHEDADTSGHKDSVTTASPASRSSSWDDVGLRAFFDSGSDIRDLLVVVFDKTNIDPARTDLPAATSLFREQNAKLAEITTRLDDMLGDWLARKQRLRGAV